VSRWKALCREALNPAPAAQVEALGGAPQQFRLQAVQVPMPKWGKACGWTARDDAMLLLGVYWCADRRPARARLPARG